MNAHNPIAPKDQDFWDECEHHHFLDETESGFRMHSEIRLLSPRAGRWVVEVVYHGNIMADFATDSIYAAAEEVPSLWDKGLHNFRSVQQNKARNI
jgi:hypothetical protein